MPFYQKFSPGDTLYYLPEFFVLIPSNLVVEFLCDFGGLIPKSENWTKFPRIGNSNVREFSLIPKCSIKISKFPRLGY